MEVPELPGMESSLLTVIAFASIVPQHAMPGA